MYMQSASGYGGGVEASPMARPGYYNKFITRVYEKDIVPQITNGEITQDLVTCNQEVQIQIAPDVPDFRSYQKNQQMEAAQITSDAKCFRVCNAVYNDIKVDELDIHFSCEMWAPYEEKLLQGLYQKWVALTREYVFTQMIAETSPQMKGNNAGVLRNVNLGAPGNPVAVNPDNIIFVLSQLMQVLRETQRFIPGEMFLIVPVQLMSVLALSKYADASFVGSCNSCSMIIDGMWNRQLFGFNVYESIHVPVTQDGNRICFYIIAGHRMAYAYIGDIIRGRIVRPDRTFGVEYQLLGVYGGKMLYEDAMAVLYCYFEY